MKKTSAKIFIALTALVIPVFIFAMPHFAQASCVPLPYSNFSFTDCILLGTSWLSQLVFQIAGALLTLAGILLNGTMVATLNISQIVNATPAIGVAWRTLRDFSSIFIIFLLLYASIKMILGLKDNNLSTLIKNIIIAGLLINFSLFFTKLAVDASNIASLSFYNAMTPGQNISSTSSISGAFSSAGLSNVFMQSLDITKIVASGGGNSGSLNDRNITLANIGGSVLMYFTAFSFIFAAIAFAVRIGILIMLMAFSPIYFIGMVLPRTQEYSEKWLKALLSMCLFMPVYLLLMYVALSVINDPNFFNFAKVTSIGATGTSNNILSASTVGIVLQYIIAFLFINAPLVAAMKIGSEGVDYAVKWGAAVKGWTQGQLTKGAKIAGTSAWQGTAGRAASKLAENEKLKDFASNWKVGGGLYKGIKATAGGYDEKLKKQVETRTKFGESLGYDQKAMNAAQANLRGLKQQLAQAQAVPNQSAAVIAGIKGQIGTAEKAKTDLENQRKENYAKRIKTRSIDALYTKVTRKDKVASAKMLIPIAEDALKHEKDDLKEIKDDIKQLQKTITNNAAIPGVGGATGTAAGTPTAAQQAALSALLTKQATQTRNVNNQEAALDQLKLTK